MPHRVKTVFVAYPISDKTAVKDLKALVEICQKVHTEQTIPVNPQDTYSRYLDSSSAEGRILARVMDVTYFKNHMVDELWLYGDNISRKMMTLMELAEEYEIPVIAKTKEIQRLLDRRGLPQ